MGLRRRGTHTKAAGGGLSTHRASGRGPCPQPGGRRGRGRAPGPVALTVGSRRGSLELPAARPGSRVLLRLSAAALRTFSDPARKEGGASAARPWPARRGGAWHAHLASGARGHLRAGFQAEAQAQVLAPQPRRPTASLRLPVPAALLAPETPWTAWRGCWPRRAPCVPEKRHRFTTSPGTAGVPDLGALCQGRMGRLED